LYTSTNIIKVMKSRRMRGAGHVACIGDMRNSYKIMVGKHEGKRLHGWPRCRWRDSNREWML